MILGIDASNVRTGGSVTHLINGLAAVEPEDYGVTKIVVSVGLGGLFEPSL